MKPKALVDPHPRTLDLLFSPEDLKRLKALEQENARLKKLLAEAALDIEVLKEINAKRW